MRIALIISSTYDSKLEDSTELNSEVATDRATIKDNFDSCYEISLPAGSLSNKSRLEQLAHLQMTIELLLQQYPQNKHIHIVLNTHGTPGKYDIDNVFILKSVQLLSVHGIKIDAMYALICDGFTSSQHSQRKYYDVSPSIFKRAAYHRSSMQMLQSTLNKLTTQTQQSFHIYGFDKPYDPIDDELPVRHLLKGIPGTGLELHVTTLDAAASSAQTKDKVARALTNYQGCLATEDETLRPDTRQQKWALNIFSREIQRRSLNIRLCLIAHKEPSTELSPRSLKLYQNVVGDAATPSTVAQYRFLQKNWNKQNPFQTNMGKPGPKLAIFTEDETTQKDDDSFPSSSFK